MGSAWVARSRSHSPLGFRVRSFTAWLLQCYSYWAACGYASAIERVMHAAVCLVFVLKPHDHISASIRAIQYLPIKPRIDFKVGLLSPRAWNHKWKSSISPIEDLKVPFVSVLRRATFRSDNHPDLGLQLSHRKLMQFRWLGLVRGTLSRLN